MKFSNQIIDILDDLCMRLGVAIDWTQENITPYLQDLCDRFISYELCTSVAWISGVGLIFLISGVLAFALHKRFDDFDVDYGMVAITVLVGFTFIFTCVLQADDIIACNTIPEKIIVELILNLTK